MAIDANILLRGIVPDVGRAVQQGLNIGSSIRNAPILRRLNEQKVAQGEQQARLQDQTMLANEQRMRINEQSLASGELTQGENESKAIYSIFGDQPLTLENYGQAVRVMQQQGIPLEEDDLIPSEENISDLNLLRETGKRFAQGSQNTASTKAVGGTRSFVQPVGVDDSGNPTYQNFRNVITLNAQGQTESQDIPVGPKFTKESGNPMTVADIDEEFQKAQKKAEGKALGEGSTADIAASTSANVAKQTDLAKAAAKQAQIAFDSASNLESSNAIYDDAIDALESGAESGAMARFFPTMRAETLKLQEAVRKAGLNTISGVTLGAISKTELDLALSVGIDERMNEDELLKHLKAKKEAQAKVAQELKRYGSYLSREGNTVASWNDMQSQIGKKGVKLTENSIPNQSARTVTNTDIETMTEAELDEFLKANQ